MHTALRSRALRRSAALVALVAGAVVLIVPPVAATPGTATPGTATPAGGCQSVTALANGGFEEPVIPDTSYRITPSAQVPGWESTDPAGIELWSSGFNGVPAEAGRQFAELNATQTGTLFQEVASRPGQSLRWSLLHRGRGGVDTMDVLIGAPGGTLTSQGNLSDGTSAWGRHSGIYTVPAGQTVTRFGFRAVSTGSGDASIGNFIDDISFGTGACVVVTSEVANVSVPGGAVHVGDTVEYRITAHNQGGSPADLAELRDTLPAGLAFVPGSLKVVTGPDAGSRTDAATDDQAEYDSPSSTVTARLGAGAGAGAGGSIRAQESTTLIYRAIVLPSATLAQLASSPTVDSTDSLSGTRTAAAAPVVVTSVAPAADLVVTQIVDTPAPVAGSDQPARFTVTVTNAGPQDDSGVQVRITPPAAFAPASVTLDGVECPVVDGVADCAVGSLAVGASRSILVSGLVDASVPDGTLLNNIASASGDLYDRDPATDTATATEMVATASDVWMTAIANGAAIGPGDEASFLFTAGNDGPSDVSGLEIDVIVPEGATVTPSEGTFDAATGRWSIASLGSGTSRTLRVTREAAELGTMWSRASVVSSTAVDADRTNEDVTAAVEVERVALLAPPAASAPPASEPGASAATDPSATDAAPVAPAGVGSAALATTGADAEAGLMLAAVLGLLGLLLLGARRREVPRHRA